MIIIVLILIHRFEWDLVVSENREVVRPTRQTFGLSVLEGSQLK